MRLGDASQRLSRDDCPMTVTLFSRQFGYPPLHHNHNAPRFAYLDDTSERSAARRLAMYRYDISVQCHCSAWGDDQNSGKALNPSEVGLNESISIFDCAWKPMRRASAAHLARRKLARCAKRPHKLLGTLATSIWVQPEQQMEGVCCSNFSKANTLEKLDNSLFCSRHIYFPDFRIPLWLTR